MPGDLSTKAIHHFMVSKLKEIEYAKKCEEKLRRYILISELYEYIYIYFTYIQKNIGGEFLKTTVKNKCKETLSSSFIYKRDGDDMDDIRKKMSHLSQLILERIQKEL